MPQTVTVDAITCHSAAQQHEGGLDGSAMALAPNTSCVTVCMYSQAAALSYVGLAEPWCNVQLSSPPAGDAPLQKLPWPREDQQPGPDDSGQPPPEPVPLSPYEGAPEPLLDRVASFLQASVHAAGNAEACV